MRYNDLNELLYHSSSTRRYFLSLPVKTQLIMHEQSAFIHTAEELRKYVSAAKDYGYHMLLGNYSE